MTSGHLEWASTTMRNIRHWNGPAKSILIHVHGVLGHSQGGGVQLEVLHSLPGTRGMTGLHFR